MPGTPHVRRLRYTRVETDRHKQDVTYTVLYIRPDTDDLMKETHEVKVQLLTYDEE